MNPAFYYVSILFAALHCFQGYQAIQETKNLREDTILFPKVKHVNETRHKNVDDNHMKVISIEMIDDKKGQYSGEDLTVSAEDNTYNEPSNFIHVDSPSENKFAERGIRVEPSIELEKISRNISTLVDKVDHAEKNTQTIEIDEDKDRLKLNESDDSKGSNLWIYSNVICILLVIGLSIFLIYYPSNESSCKNSESSSTSTSSTASSSAA